MDRSTWNHEKIEEEAQTSKPSEPKIASVINEALDKHAKQNCPNKLVVIARNADKEKFAGFDGDLVLQCGDGRVVNLLRMEFEEGKYQHDWTDKLPSKIRWPRGCSVVLRKIATKYDFFVKMSTSAQSFFAYSKAWLIDNIKSGKISQSQNNHCLKYKTCDEFYNIDWKIVEEQAALAEPFFVHDNFDRLALLVRRMAKERAN